MDCICSSTSEFLSLFSILAFGLVLQYCIDQGGQMDEAMLRQLQEASLSQALILTGSQPPQHLGQERHSEL